MYIIHIIFVLYILIPPFLGTTTLHYTILFTILHGKVNEEYIIYYTNTIPYLTTIKKWYDDAIVIGTE